MNELSNERIVQADGPLFTIAAQRRSCAHGCNLQVSQCVWSLSGELVYALWFISSRGIFVLRFAVRVAIIVALFVGSSSLWDLQY